MSPPRVAFFPDSFHEVNGVAHTSRNFTSYAERRGLPFLCIRAGGDGVSQEGELRTLELQRGPASIRVEKDLKFDTLFPRHHGKVRQALSAFKPDLIHITGPSELGILGAYFAWRLKLPLAASWHTNLHEYAGRRMHWLTRHMEASRGLRVERSIEVAALSATTRFYRLAGVLFAPNPELCNLLEERTSRPCYLMQRGVDTGLFSPERRTRLTPSKDFILGYVGRLSIEKNVALLPLIEQRLHAMGITNLRFLIIGHGSEEASLRSRLRQADFAGVLRGEELARAYANMDMLVFPSHTDTFGNVVLEALASGVPAIVTPYGGPKHIVRHDHTGFLAPFRETPGLTEEQAFADAIGALVWNPLRLGRMSVAARQYALQCSWDSVFDRVYNAYRILPWQALNDGTRADNLSS